MGKYLLEVSYSAEGLKAVLAKGGSARKAAAQAAARSVGGKLESFYFAFGATDAYVVVDAPDNVSVAAVAMAVSASGIGSIRTVVLMTPDEVDEAAQKKVNYKPPTA